MLRGSGLQEGPAAEGTWPGAKQMAVTGSGRPGGPAMLASSPPASQELGGQVGPGASGFLGNLGEQEAWDHTHVDRGVWDCGVLGRLGAQWVTSWLCVVSGA